MSKIVFVVGAGASKDLCASMPIGGELAESIEKLLSDDLQSGNAGPVSTAFMRSGSGLGAAQIEAMRRIRASILSQDSIDEFLSEWRDVPHIDEAAKIAIAHLILDAERRSALCMESAAEADVTTRLRQFNPTWIGQVLRRPTGRRRDVDTVLREVAFIVFNYDRILEQYLFLYLTSVIAKSPEEAIDLINSFVILHPYGCLGLITEAAPLVPFGASELQTPTAARNIRTYNESHPDTVVRAVRAEIYSADKIVFLGCAYHDQNIELLFGNGEFEESRPRIFGTSFGMSSRKRDAKIEQLSTFGPVMNFDSLECSDFMRLIDEAIFG